ncbi:MAG TPA: AI-2E family transporter [Vicinamibacterales bacterium]|jgi:predicted PurR-regulated permease PerM
MPPSATTLEAIGWLALTGLLAVFIALGLLKFIVFLLFMRLVMDLLVDSLGNRVGFMSRKAILYAVSLIVAGVIALLAAVVVPSFAAELPAYTLNLDRNLTGKVTELLASTGVSVDVEMLKVRAMEWGREHVGESMSLARRAGTNVVLLIMAYIITVVVKHDRIGEADARGSGRPPDNLWEFLADFLGQKIGTFYRGFRQVMAGQVVIALVNAALTVGLLVVLGIPHKTALTVLVFVFGLLPIVGNLISNTVICVSALLWTGPAQVLVALAFLVVIHKLEYVLNGKIIGHMVKLPLHLTLLGLIVGELLFHISGMILAIPLILFVRAELAAVEIGAPQSS